MNDQIREGLRYAPVEAEQRALAALDALVAERDSLLARLAAAETERDRLRKGLREIAESPGLGRTKDIARHAGETT